MRRPRAAHNTIYSRGLGASSPRAAQCPPVTSRSRPSARRATYNSWFRRQDNDKTKSLLNYQRGDHHPTITLLRTSCLHSGPGCCSPCRVLASHGCVQYSMLEALANINTFFFKVSDKSHDCNGQLLPVWTAWNIWSRSLPLWQDFIKMLERLERFRHEVCIYGKTSTGETNPEANSLRGKSSANCWPYAVDKQIKKKKQHNIYVYISWILTDDLQHFYIWSPICNSSTVDIYTACVLEHIRNDVSHT